MPVICWSVLHSAAAPIVHAAARTARHTIGPAARHVLRVSHAAHGAATHPLAWFQTVCRFVPAALAGAILAVPQPMSAPPSITPPIAALQEPLDPGLLPVFPFGAGFGGPGFDPGPITPAPLVTGQGTSTADSGRGNKPDEPTWPPNPSQVPEPASDIVLLMAIGVLMLIPRKSRGSGRRRTDRE
jgi:hypothetical protein